MTELQGALDVWNILVMNIGGSFLMAMLFCIILLFIILLLGRVSIYTTLWYLIFFITIMTLGYGEPIYMVLLTVVIIVSFVYAVTGWIGRAGQ